MRLKTSRGVNKYLFSCRNQDQRNPYLCIFCQAPRKKYGTNQTDLYYIECTWLLDLLESVDYGTKK